MPQCQRAVSSKITTSVNRQRPAPLLNPSRLSHICSKQTTVSPILKQPLIKSGPLQKQIQAQIKTIDRRLLKIIMPRGLLRKHQRPESPCRLTSKTLRKNGSDYYLDLLSRTSHRPLKRLGSSVKIS